MKTTTLFQLLTLVLIAARTLSAAELHISVQGNDDQCGSKSQPLRIVQRAAELAQPGDLITVHAGTYRERINPPRGGTSERARIIYQAAPGEAVTIKGSEVVKTWVQVQGKVWKLTLPNSFFASFNPYNDLIRGDWFDGKGREHHTGAVYLNGEWLIEAANLGEVLGSKAPAWVGRGEGDLVNTNPGLWFAKVDDSNTTIWAQFADANPNEQTVEINVRKTVFYPDQPGRNYITVRGFTLRDAATPWAPPTAEQAGLIGTHWSKGWIIENNIVSHSVCCGIALGKHGDEFDNTSANTAEGYVKTIERALNRGWNQETIGHHIVRNNTISHCEQAGVVGSMGAAFSMVTGNTIHDIHVRRFFTGAEMAGIKFHAAIDTTISHNHIYRTCLGLWLDWMAQGTRVSRNVFHDNAGQDLFLEVNHGPFLVDNNLFLSGTSLLDMSEGGAYVHNLFNGKIVTGPEPNRETPFHPAHSTTLAGLKSIKGGDDRFYNNIFIGNGQPPTRPKPETASARQWTDGYGPWVYDLREVPLQTGGNVFFNNAQPYAKESGPVVAISLKPKLSLLQEGALYIIRMNVGEELRKAQTRPVTTALLGKAKVPDLYYENADGSPLAVSRDFLGKKRNSIKPTPGPFERPGTGEVSLRVW